MVIVLSFVFWGCSRVELGFKTEVQREGSQETPGFEDAPLSSNQSIFEREMEELRSATEQEKAVIMPISHSSWINNGVYEVFGEVENIGERPGRNILTRIIYKDPTWFTRLAVVETPVDRPTLAPGQTSAFRSVYRGNPRHVGSYVLMTVTDSPTTGFIEDSGDDFRGDTTATAAVLQISGDDEDSRGGRKASADDDGLAGPNWLILLLLITSAVWGAFRYAQWR